MNSLLINGICDLSPFVIKWDELRDCELKILMNYSSMMNLVQI